MKDRMTIEKLSSLNPTSFNRIKLSHCDSPDTSDIAVIGVSKDKVAYVELEDNEFKVIPHQYFNVGQYLSLNEVKLMNKEEMHTRLNANECAIKLSIDKYQRLLECGDVRVVTANDIKGETCALCYLFKRGGCRNCPLTNCETETSSWHRVKNAWMAKDQKAFNVACSIMLSLLGHALNEKHRLLALNNHLSNDNHKGVKKTDYNEWVKKASKNLADFVISTIDGVGNVSLLTTPIFSMSNSNVPTHEVEFGLIGRGKISFDLTFKCNGELAMRVTDLIRGIDTVNEEDFYKACEAYNRRIENE